MTKPLTNRLAFATTILTAALTAPVALAAHAPYHVDVHIGQLSVNATKGQAAFNQTCAQCHGDNAQGSEKGPPLIHAIYNPGHHGNQAIYNAVLHGAQQHHWPFGDMPPQKVGFADVANIVQFIREVQVQNGIKTEQHMMR